MAGHASVVLAVVRLERVLAHPFKPLVAKHSTPGCALKSPEEFRAPGIAQLVYPLCDGCQGQNSVQEQERESRLLVETDPNTKVISLASTATV